jgi:hypothetical protein
MNSRKSTLTLIIALAMTVQANAQQPQPRCAFSAGDKTPEPVTTVK